MIEKLQPLMDMLEKYSLPYDVVYTNFPGRIVYEDEWQIAVQSDNTSGRVATLSATHLPQYTLFDKGYITVTQDLHIEVSKRIKEDYGNGKEYYAFQGKELIAMPDNIQEKPSPQFLRWHNENVFMV